MFEIVTDFYDPFTGELLAVVADGDTMRLYSSTVEDPARMICEFPFSAVSKNQQLGPVKNG